MAKDFQDIVKELVINQVENWGSQSKQAAEAVPKPGGMSKGLLLGAGAAALTPVAVKQLAKRMGIESLEDLVSAPGETVENLTGTLGDKVGSGIGDKVTGKLDEAGGPSGVLKDTLKGVLPFGGGSGGGGGDKNDVPGVGKGRRMPVQQSVDIGAPIETVYNQFTQFEHWPVFMHRVKRASQEDDNEVSFAVKIWGKTKEFTVQIETQRPDERIKWDSTQGMTHHGVVTFHELGPNLTRVLVGFDVDPGGMLEKAARGLRHVKRATRADLHRFKAFIEMAEHETGAWRGVIEDGEVVEEHDPSYDEQREYSDIEDFTPEGQEDEDESDEEEEPEEQEDDEQPDEEDEQEEEEEEEEQPVRGRARSSSRNGNSRSSSRGRQSESGGRSRSRNGSSGGRTRSRSSSSGSGSGGRSRSRSRGSD
jgi:uncharacterized membrane protein